MKLYKSFLFVSALMGAMLTSCSDSGYWDEAPSADLGNGQTYSFNNATQSFVFPAAETVEGTDVEIIINRGTTQGSVTLPVKAVFSDSEAMSGPESITFADGASSAAYPVHFNKELVPGKKMTATLSIDPKNLGFDVVEPAAKPKEGSTREDSVKYNAYVTYQNRLKNYKLSTVVTFSKVLTWKESGKCMFVDYVWASSGAAAENVTILNAVGTNMYRIVTPYQAIYTDDPNDGFDTDTGFTFYLNDDLSIDFDEEIGTVGWPGSSYQFVWGVGQFAPYASYCSVTRQDNIYDVRCLRLLNEEKLYTGHFAFMWTEGWPGAN